MPGTEDVQSGYYCGIHEENFPKRSWCPLCEIEYDFRERGKI